MPSEPMTEGQARERARAMRLKIGLYVASGGRPTMTETLETGIVQCLLAVQRETAEACAEIAAIVFNDFNCKH